MFHRDEATRVNDEAKNKDVQEPRLKHRAAGPCMVSIVTVHVCFVNPEKYKQSAEQCRGKFVFSLLP